MKLINQLREKYYKDLLPKLYFIRVIIGHPFFKLLLKAYTVSVCIFFLLQFKAFSMANLFDIKENISAYAAHISTYRSFDSHLSFKHKLFNTYGFAKTLLFSSLQLRPKFGNILTREPALAVESMRYMLLPMFKSLISGILSVVLTVTSGISLGYFLFYTEFSSLHSSTLLLSVGKIVTSCIELISSTYRVLLVLKISQILKHCFPIFSPEIVGEDSISGWIACTFLSFLFTSLDLAMIIRKLLHKAIKKEYVIMAKVKGLKQSHIMLYYLLPQCIIECVSTLTDIISDCIAGNTFLETCIFSLHGMGYISQQAFASARFDHNLATAVVTYWFVLYNLSKELSRYLSRKITKEGILKFLPFRE